MTPELQNTLAALAQKLGTSVEYLWPLLVRHAYISSLTSLISYGSLSILSLIGSILLARISIGAFKSNLKDECLPIVCLWMASVLLLITIFSATSAIGSLPNVMVPEAAAVKSIMGR